MSRSSIPYRDLVFSECQPEPEHAFPKEEYRARLERVRALMNRHKIDCLFLTSPESMCYLTGYQAEWYQAQSPKQWPATSGVAVHRDQDKVILFDTQREQILIRYCTLADDVRIFPPSTQLRDGIGFIANELKMEGWLAGNIGLEFWSYRPNRVISQRFEAAFNRAGAHVIDGSHVLREARWLKTPREREAVREAARIADIGLQAARDALRPGAMELEVYGAMVHAMAAAGGENPSITMPVLSGRKSCSPHAMASRRKIAVGDIVFIDLCGVHKRYHVNEARTFSIGMPADDVIVVANKAIGSLAIIERLLQPNLSVAALVDELKAYYQAVDLWDFRSWLGGYELGISFPPDWVGNFVYDLMSEVNQDRSFEPGAVVNYENQFFLPRMVGGFMVINSLLFDDDGATFLSRFPSELQILS
jgi:Xaa-Pro aminopeptidase